MGSIYRRGDHLRRHRRRHGGGRPHRLLPAHREEPRRTSTSRPCAAWKGIKEAKLTIRHQGLGDLSVKVAVAHGLGNAARPAGKGQNRSARRQERIRLHRDHGLPRRLRRRRRPALWQRHCRPGPSRRGALPRGQGPGQAPVARNPGVALIYEKFLGHPGSLFPTSFLHTYYFERSLLNGTCVREVTPTHGEHQG